MNFSFLPTKIKKQVEAIAVGKTPLALARSNTSLDGESGESYVVAYKETLFFFSRKLGDRDYSVISGDFGKNIDNVQVKKDGINALLDVTIDGKHYSLKFSSFEEKDLIPIMENFAAASPLISPSADTVAGETAPAAETPASGQAVSSTGDDKLPSLMAGMITALMFVAKADDDIAKEEDQYIIMICNDDKPLMQAALKYYKGHSFDELLIAMSSIKHEQKLCCLANMMEIGMSDGVLHRSEMKVMRQFCRYMDITEDEYDSIKQVLLVKNQLSVMK